MSRLTTTLAGAAAAALILGGPATAFAANSGHGHGHNGTHSNHGKSKMHFTAVGKVVSVDGGSLTLHDKGGSKDLHGTDVTVTVPDTVTVILDDQAAQLSDLVAGDHVTVVGSRSDTGLTARHVNAESAPSTDTTDTTDTTSTDSTTTDTTGTTTDTTGTTTDTTGTTSTTTTA